MRIGGVWCIFVVFLFFLFFFFKQKTAYEVLTCDWSSDVCSSDLAVMPILDEALNQNKNIEYIILSYISPIKGEFVDFTTTNTANMLS